MHHAFGDSERVGLGRIRLGTIGAGPRVIEPFNVPAPSTPTPDLIGFKSSGPAADIHAPVITQVEGKFGKEEKDVLTREASS